MLCAATVAAGCGGSSRTPAATHLEREDLAAVARALAEARPAAGREAAASKRAWPLIANGLRSPTGALTAPVEAARQAAAEVKLPTLFGETTAAAITGPGSPLAGLFRTYVILSQRGWQLIAGDIGEAAHGSPAGAAFARANVGLYIESVYDAQFSLAQVGKQLQAAYTRLGGPAAFGSSLTQAQVDAIAASYSEAADRLYPHVGVRLGS